MLRILALLLVTATIMSCSKDEAKDENNQLPNGCLITSFEQQGAYVTYFDYNSARQLVVARSGNFAIDSILYNAQGKPATIRTHYQGALYSVTNLTFNGAGQIAQIVTVEYDSVAPIDTTTYTHTYQGGFLSKVLSESTDYSSADYYTFAANGNLLKLMMYVIENGVEQLQFENHHTYGQVLNPYYGLQDLGSEDASVNAPEKDSIIYYDIISGMSNTTVRNYTYTTNADNLPVQSIRTSDNGDTDVENFTYNCR